MGRGKRDRGEMWERVERWVGEKRDGGKRDGGEKGE